MGRAAARVGTSCHGRVTHKKGRPGLGRAAVGCGLSVCRQWVDWRRLVSTGAAARRPACSLVAYSIPPRSTRHRPAHPGHLGHLQEAAAAPTARKAVERPKKQASRCGAVRCCGRVARVAAAVVAAARAPSPLRLDVPRGPAWHSDFTRRRAKGPSRPSSTSHCASQEPPCPSQRTSSGSAPLL